jgi:hypothetical protein
MSYQRAPNPEIARQERTTSLTRDAVILFMASGTIAAGICTLYGLSMQLATGAGVAFGFFVTAGLHHRRRRRRVKADIPDIHDDEHDTRLAWVRVWPAPKTTRPILSCATEADLRKLVATPGTVARVKSHMSIFVIYWTSEPAALHEIVESSPDRTP